MAQIKSNSKISCHTKCYQIDDRQRLKISIDKFFFSLPIKRFCIFFVIYDVFSFNTLTFWSQFIIVNFVYMTFQLVTVIFCQVGCLLRIIKGQSMNSNSFLFQSLRKNILKENGRKTERHHVIRAMTKTLENNAGDEHNLM